jgi:outer membrane protein assembly factor BamB
MIQYLKRSKLLSRSRPEKRRDFLLFIVASLFIAACGTTTANTNWPGMSVKDDVVYVAYGPNVVAVDIAAEEELWSYRPSDVPATVQLFAQPSVDGQSVVVGDYGESGGILNPRVTVRIYGLDDQELESVAGIESPDEIWRNEVSAEDRIVAGPLQVGDRVFVGTNDNFMIALDQSSGGSFEWSFETGKPVWSQPEYEDGILYMGSMDGFVYALDAESGEEIWNRSLGGAVAANLELENNLLYANSYNRNASALDPATGEIVWQVDTPSSVWSGSAVTESEVFFVDLNGHVYAADATTGDVIWTVELGELVQATPAYADGVLYVTTTGRSDVEDEERQGTLFALSAEDGEILWQERTQYLLFTGPAVIGDSVVVALLEQSELLLVFDRHDGSLLWTFDRPDTEAE